MSLLVKKLSMLFVVVALACLAGANPAFAQSSQEPNWQIGYCGPFSFACYEALDEFAHEMCECVTTGECDGVEEAYQQVSEVCLAGGNPDDLLDQCIDSGLCFED